MDAFVIKRGDTSPAIRFAMKPVTNDIGGSLVQFQMRGRDGTLLVDQPATIVSGLPPVVQYNWTAPDTETAGVFDAEFRVTYADGGIETFPNSGFIPVRIGEDVR